MLAAWCEACGLDGERFRPLAALARRADGPVPGWFETWLAAARSAALLKHWSQIIVPALFQTAEYARALLLAAQTDTSDDAVSALVAARLDRVLILSRAGLPEVVALIDELALHRLVGSSTIMHEELPRLARLSEQTHVCVQIEPTAAGATAGLSGDMSLARGDGAPDVPHTDAAPEARTTESR